MKNWKRFLALLLSGAMALSLFACKSGDSGASPSVHADATAGGPSDRVDSSADPSSSPEIVADLSQGVLEFSAGMSAGDPALTVDGEDIPADLFLYWLNYNCYYFMMSYGMYGYSVADYADALLDDTVSFCANETMLRHKAAQLGCLPTDAQLQAARDSIPEDTAQLLRSAYGLSDDSIRYLSLSDAYYENVMAAAVQEPSQQELDEYIDAQGVFAVKHILLSTVDQATQEPLEDSVIAEKRTQAEDLLAQLQGVGADGLEARFDELMNQHSEDGGLQNNPDGYVFDNTDSLVGGFREAALELEIGGLSGIVETDYGYHIMLRLPLDGETVDQCREDFRAEALGTLVEQWVSETDVGRAGALSSLDVAGFFERQMAYQQALSEKDAPAGSAAP